MPIKIDQHCEERTDKSKDYGLSMEMENLVQKIQEGLRLKAKEKQQTYRRVRPSPYCIPRAHASGKQTSCCEKNMECVHLGPRKLCRTMHKMKTSDIDLEPYELLQKLLREQTLIQEAVNRLQRQANFDFDESDQAAWSPSDRLHVTTPTMLTNDEKTS